MFCFFDSWAQIVKKQNKDTWCFVSRQAMSSIGTGVRPNPSEEGNWCRVAQSALLFFAGTLKFSGSALVFCPLCARILLAGTRQGWERM